MGGGGEGGGRALRTAVPYRQVVDDSLQKSVSLTGCKELEAALSDTSGSVYLTHMCPLSC